MFYNIINSMHKKYSFREMIKKKGSIQFLIRILVFLIIFSIEALIIKIFVDFTFQPDIIGEMYLPFRMPLILLLTSIIFYLMSRHKLGVLKKLEKINYKKLSILFIVNIISFILFLKLNLFFNRNPYYAIENKILLIPTWYVLAIILGGSLFASFFSFNYMFKFFKNFHKEIIISYVLAIGFKFMYLYFSRAWNFFSGIVAKVVYFMLKITYFNTTTLTITKGTPVLSSEGFGARIYAPCSGVEGMTLFITLFLIMLLIEWRYINKIKSFLLLILGTAGAFGLNIIRVYLIYILGINVSEEFAIGFFHSNIGWILFSAYFIIFELLFYQWIRKGKVDKLNVVDI